MELRRDPEMMMDLENKILYVDMYGVVGKWENATFKEVSTEGFFISREPVKTMLEEVRLIYEAVLKYIFSVK